MPLLRRKPFTLAEPPKDLEPYELVYQVRFTKEIFRNYQDYLNRINLYRHRVWVCKSTGKTNLTYEEALVSEKHAAEKVQELPKELVAPALRIIQFSMLSLKDLADTIATKLQERLFVGAEVYGRKDDGLHSCKILKVPEVDGNKTQYEIAWLDKNKKTIESGLLDGEALDGLLVYKKRRKIEEERNKEAKEEAGKCKRAKLEGSTMEKNLKKEDYQLKEEAMKYPIDDLLVQPAADDPVFTDRPSPSRDFNVPMDSVGDLLMIWDFCSSFSKLLHLWPFSFEDFENAICHKDSNLALIMELHSALLRLLIKDNGENSLPIKNKTRKITLINWTEYLCDFLEIVNIPELCCYMATIKRGHYGLLDANAKLGILQELVNQALETDLIREKLDEQIEQRRALGATRREEALEAARQEREEKERLKAQSVANGVSNGHSLESARKQLHISSNGKHARKNGETTEKRNGKIISSQQKNSLESKPSNAASKRMSRRQNMDVKVPIENGKNSFGKEALKQLRDDKKETTERRSKKQRREYFEREMEKRIIRTNALGRDRDYNRYWWFRHDWRIFVESSDSKKWGYFSSKEELDALIGSLNPKGERERTLQKQLEIVYDKIKSEMEKRSKNIVEKISMEESVLRRSTRVRAPPRENPVNAFLRYVNKWKED